MSRGGRRRDRSRNERDRQLVDRQGVTVTHGLGDLGGSGNWLVRKYSRLPLWFRHVVTMALNHPPLLCLTAK